MISGQGRQLMNEVERRKEHKRKDITNAAWELFRAWGFKKVGIFEPLSPLHNLLFCLRR